MDMEIVRLATLSWLQIADRQVLALRDASAWNVSPIRPNGFSAEILRPVPVLDWPSTLFDDEVLHH